MATKSEPKINVIVADIWISHCGSQKMGYALMLGFKDGCAIRVFENKYKKNVITQLRLYRKLLNSISINDKFEILHRIHDLVKAM